MFDSHCHVTDLEDPVAALRAAKQIGVTSLLCCGYNMQSNLAVLSLQQRIRGLPIAIGLHPWYVAEPLVPVLELIERVRPSAIGECGLDGYARDPEIPPLGVQLEAFDCQLALAARLGLPVTVHSRKAVNEVIKATERYPTVRGVLHAYSGSYEQVRPLLGRGWLVGVGGGFTRSGAHRMHRMVARLALDELLFETDAPAIGLEGVMPPDVRPHHTLDIARTFAASRNMALDELIARTDENARRLFGDRIFQSWSLPDP